MHQIDPQELPDAAPLSCAPDRRFDAIAALTCRLVEAPTALVTLVDHTQQVFPGAFGLPSPWQEFRFTPLTHSFCQHVVSSGAPLVITDTRTQERFAGNLAIPEMGVVAYAGFPIRDADGRPVGSLCAIDSRPREWSVDELAILAEMAAFCSTELTMRSASIREAVVADRDRLAGELQYGVTSDLLALAMLLGGVRTMATPESADMVEDAIDAVDQILSRLRATVVRGADN